MLLRMAVFTFATLSAGCRSDDAPFDDAAASAMTFDTTSLRLASARDTITISAELAVTEEQKRMGLMERRSLADDAGMLFIYAETQAANRGFWMFRTRIPLDIAFADSAGVIRSIRTMEPCPAQLAQGCPTYEPGVPYRIALEMNGGFFARRGIGVGDRILLEDIPAGSP